MKFDHLRNVSRSFELAIKALPHPLKDQMATAYLLCRVLDTIEDSIDLKNPTECFEDFLVSFTIQTPPPHFSFGTKDEKKLLEFLGELHQEFFTYPEKVQTIMLDCFSEMAYGMNKFRHHSLKSTIELDIYCHFVAGTVGIMLTKLFAHYMDKDQAWIDDQLPFAHEFSLGLQKLNIAKDVEQDKIHGRTFIPDSLEREELKEMVLIHLEKAQNYIYHIPHNQVGLRLFCLWPLCTAILTVNHFPKVSRKVMEEMMKETTLMADDDKHLKEYIAYLLRNAHSHRKDSGDSRLDYSVR